MILLREELQVSDKLFIYLLLNKMILSVAKRLHCCGLTNRFHINKVTISVYDLQSFAIITNAPIRLTVHMCGL